MSKSVWNGHFSSPEPRSVAYVLYPNDSDGTIVRDVGLCSAHIQIWRQATSHRLWLMSWNTNPYQSLVVVSVLFLLSLWCVCLFGLPRAIVQTGNATHAPAQEKRCGETGEKGHNHNSTWRGSLLWGNCWCGFPTWTVPSMSVYYSSVGCFQDRCHLAPLGIFGLLFFFSPKLVFCVVCFWLKIEFIYVSFYSR